MPAFFERLRTSKRDNHDDGSVKIHDFSGAAGDSESCSKSAIDMDGDVQRINVTYPGEQKQ
jgi:hypothetical protein